MSLDFAGEEMSVVNGAKQWSRSKMHFDTEAKTWTCDEEAGRTVDGKEVVSKHSSAGTYTFSNDRSKLRLLVERHTPGTIEGNNQPSDELDPAVGKVVELDYEHHAGVGHVPTIFNAIPSHGHVKAIA